jgi:hypothetical protein
MTTALIINMALSIPMFAVVIGLAVWSFRTQHGDRVHVLARRTRRPAVAPRPRYSTPSARRQAWLAQ